LRNTWYFSRAT